MLSSGAAEVMERRKMSTQTPEKRLTKSLILVLAAVIAIGGTIVTAVIQAHYQDELAAAQTRYAIEKGQMDHADELRQRALMYDQHAAILIETHKAGYGVEGTARTLAFYSFDTARNVWSSAKTSQPTEGAGLNPVASCGKTFINSPVEDSELALDCWTKAITARMYSEDHVIKGLDVTIGAWGKTATVLQLMGIIIAFAKDLV
jgi:hypothetical protein